MIDAVRCENTDEHRFHEHHIDVEVHCSGKARCGSPTHEPHTFTENQRHWCPGICTCGLGSRGLHGPGDHK